MMCDIALQDAEHYLELGRLHRFDHESFIMCKEEKAATLPGALSSLKYLFSIKLRRETFLEHLQTYFIGFEQFSKLVKLVICDFCF